MKNNVKKIVLFIVFNLLLITLQSCGGGEFKIEGRVRAFSYLGFKCWYIINENDGFYYEIVSPDQFLLQQGMKTKMVAKYSDTETICNVGQPIDVISYRVYDVK